MKIGDSKKGSTLGSILLIGGSCIGSGMLAAPISSAMAGFVPAMVMFALSWLFMTTTGLLILEVNLYFDKEVNIITMADRTIGKLGQAVAWFLFAFMFYAIMVSYASGSGVLFADFADELFNLKIPDALGSIIFVIFFGIMVYYGTFAVDQLNRIFMLGLIVTYFMLVGVASPHVQEKLLKHIDWSQAVWALPVMVITFGYHNLIPSLTTYLHNDKNRMRIAIILGSSIPLFAYLVWEWLTLGIISVDQFADAAGETDMITHTLKIVAGSSLVTMTAQYFAFFAIVTSFLGVALSFVDFLADGLQIKKDRAGKLVVVLMALLPPLFFSLLYPNIFVVALQYAGGFGAVILFGLLPALMVWKGRYSKRMWTETMVPGGKITLLCVILFAVATVIIQLFNATS